MSTPRGLAILGSTGSIGRSTLAVVALHPERFRVAVLGAHSSWQAIVEQAYRKGRYHSSIDYQEPPEPPLTGADAAWAAKLLRKILKNGAR